MNLIEIFLAEDHQMVRSGLKLIINAESEMSVVGDAAVDETALEVITQLQPRVAVIDLSLANRRGLELVTRLQARSNNPHILVLTANEDPGDLKLLLQLGAAGYLFKRASAAELILAIRTVARGERFLCHEIVDLILEQLTRRVTTASETEVSDATVSVTSAVALSDRERNVLRMIAEGLTNKEIAARLNISIKSVETYKARGMQKLKLRGRPDIVRHAVTLGWFSVT